MREARDFKLPEKTTHKNCSFCENNDFSDFSTENGFSIVKCRHCGLVMVNPAPDEKYLNDFYEKYHVEGSASEWKTCMRNIFLNGLGHLDKYPKGSKLLDIGCGFGHFLNLAKKQDFDVFGVELAGKAADYAEKEYGIPVIKGSLKDVEFENSSFDVITLWCVLEHLLDPAATIRKCYELLKKDGTLMLLVPNMDFRKFLLPFQGNKLLEKFLRGIGITVETVGFFNTLDPPAHLYGYNVRSLSYLLNKTGFKSFDFSIPANAVYSNLITRSVEFTINSLARTVDLLSNGKRKLSVGLLAAASK